jgi:AcrR family transcriptional regulator
MNSNKSRPASRRGALEPQRRRGRLRVAALMESAAAVISEKGLEATTMAEIAARAGAPIGSLYRFFPNKGVLAAALLRRYWELVDDAFGKINGEVSTLSIAALVDAFLDLMVKLHAETRAIIPLLDVHSPKREEFRAAILTHIARTLKLRRPKLSPVMAETMAVVVLYNMKAMKQLTFEEDEAKNRRVIAEFREMTRLYLASKLGE